MTQKIKDIESTKKAIEQSEELSVSQILDAYLTNHAVEMYCAALHKTEEERAAVEQVLEMLKKEDGVYWLYTQPAVDGKNAKGENLPTSEEWLSQNEGAVRVAKLAGKQWFKRPYVLGSLKGVNQLVSGFSRYIEDKEGAKEREQKKLEAAAAVLGVSVEELLALKK
jgi:hypothetical protein